MKIIRPHSTFKRQWESLIFWCALYSITIIPIRIGFDLPFDKVTMVFDILVGIIFIIDLGVNFVTGYSQHGIFIKKPKQVAQHYAKTWFGLDLVTNFPYEIAALFLVPEIWNIQTLSLLSLPHLLRVIRLFRFLSLWERDPNTQPALVKVVRLVVLLGFVTHWIACGWFFIQVTEGFEVHDWFINAPQDSGNLWTQYLFSAYWSMTTLTSVGYGDITPSTRLEVAYTTFAMIIGVSLYTFLIGNIATIVAKLDARQAIFREKMDTVRDYLSYRNLPNNVKRRVIDHYEFLWSRTKGFNEASFLNELPRTLRLDISTYLAWEIIEKIPLFNACCPDLLTELITSLHPQLFAPGEFLTKPGDLNGELFFVTGGHAEVLDSEGNIVSVFKRGDYFGEMSIILSESRTASVRAKEYCDVFVLEKEDFEHIIEVYPEFKESFKKSARKQSELKADLLMKDLIL